MNRDRTYCINEECPYTKCDKHQSQLKGATGIFSFADYDKTCRKYIGWLSYSNYQKYIELKEAMKGGAV